MKNNFSKLAREWIKRAEDDLLFAKAGFEDGFYNQVCFLSHQTVEKYLKAYLIISKGNLKKKEKIHDLPKLTKFCQKFGLDLTDYYQQLRTLSEFYLPVRYPDVSFRSFDKETAKEALNMAKIIVEKIKEKFNQF